MHTYIRWPLPPWSKVGLELEELGLEACVLPAVVPFDEIYGPGQWKLPIAVARKVGFTRTPLMLM